MNDLEPVSCRVKPTNWWIIPLGSAEALFVLVTPFMLAKTAPSGEPFWGLLAFGAPFAAFCLYGVAHLALRLARGFIRAEGSSLHWRQTVREYSVKWDEVTDYYDVAPPHGTRKFAIETRAGKLEVDGRWTNTGALRTYVQEHATQSQSQEWRVQAKDENWPLVFQYRHWENRWALPIIVAGGLFVWPSMFGAALISFLRTGFRDFGILPGLLFVLLMLFLMFVMPYAYARTMVPTLRDIRCRENECISATPEGLIFQDGTRRIEARWDAITDYYIKPSGSMGVDGVYVVETVHGAIEFVREIKPYGALPRLIQEHATKSASREWRFRGAKDIETLGGEAGKWRDGQRVHSYRTRSNRAMLWMPMAFCILMPLVLVLRVQGVMPSKDPPSVEAASNIMVSVASLGLILFTTLMCWAYKKFAVRTDDRGITQIKWRGSQFIPWQEITDFYRTESRYYVTGRGNDQIYFRATIADVIELRDEIARRAVNAESNEWREH